ncbi:MAG: hypothetical protein AAGG68_15270 [Bacteroidota bacterium]
MKFYGLLLFVIFTFACAKENVDPNDDLFLEIEDLAFLGGDYEGTLTYLDFESDVNANLNVRAEYYMENNKLKYTHFVDEGNGKTEKKKGSFSIKNGKINGAKLLKRTMEQSNNTLTLVYEEEGKDDGRKARLRHTIIGNDDSLLVQKEVCYEGEDNFFIRNRFDFTRS